VRADLLLDRADGRAREAAEAFAKEVAPRPAELRALAAAKGLAVAETPFLARGDKDKVEGVKDASRLVGALFGVAELGGVSRAVYDSEAKTTFVARYTAKEPAPPAEFAEASKALRPAGLERARQEAQHEFETRVLLEAQSVDEAILKESYELRYGAEGIATIEAATIFVAMDDEVLRSELAKKAKRDAEATLAEIRRGGRFDELARKRSQDGMRRRGGDTRWFTRGKLPQELAGLTAIEDAAFTLKPGETSEPIETALGWHLLQVTERRGEEVRCRHMLFRNQRALDEDGTLAPLDPEVEKLAMEKALEKAKKAEERVKSGEDFGAVARELSDIPAYGQKHPYSFETPFTRQVFAEAPGEVSKVLDAGGGSWQLLLVEEWTPPEERDDALRRGQAKPRLVRRITASGERGKRALEQAREELADIRAGLERDAASGRTGGGRSSIQWEFTKAFEDLAREESAAPSGARGGRLGIFRPDPSASRFGAEFRETLFALKEGETSALVKTRDGYHLVRVLGRVRKSYEEARREVADGLLQGLSF
jgi:parvulin-like peptidyl-prolyl isomerase